MDGEYHSQARQALLIAVYQLVGAGFGLLMYWNYQMVHPYLTPIFWAIICSTALHTTKTKFVGYLMHCDRLLDTRCLRWERHNFCTRAIARFLMIPGLVVSETLLKVLGAPTSRGGNRLVKLCTWLASAASHVIRKLGDFEVNFRLGLAVVAIACVVSLVGYTGSFLVDTFWLICISSVILCIILSILIMLIIYPKYSEATYSTIVSASLLFFFVVFIGLILSVAALKIVDESTLALELISSAAGDNKQSLLDALENMGAPVGVDQLGAWLEQWRAEASLWARNSTDLFVGGEGDDMPSLSVVKDFMSRASDRSDDSGTMSFDTTMNGGLLPALNRQFSKLSIDSAFVSNLYGTVNKHLGSAADIAKHFSSSFLQALFSILSGAFWFVSLGLDCMLFLACSYYLLLGRVSPIKRLL
eukprot:707781_1